jgi:hypothetical protein
VFESCQGHECVSLVSVVFYLVEVSVTGRSLVQSSYTECGVFDCDLETSTTRRPKPIGLSNHDKQNNNLVGKGLRITPD